MEVDDVAIGEELGHPRSENSEMGPAILSCFRTGVPGDPILLSDLEANS